MAEKTKTNAKLVATRKTTTKAKAPKKVTKPKTRIEIPIPFTKTKKMKTLRIPRGLLLAMTDSDEVRAGIAATIKRDKTVKWVIFSEGKPHPSGLFLIGVGYRTRLKTETTVVEYGLGLGLMELSTFSFGRVASSSGQAG
jgi:hypothetical protein